MADADEVTLVASVLRDPDRGMASSAVGRHVDRRAAALLTGPRFTDWSAALADACAGDDFLVRRLREWTLLDTVARGGPWSADEVTGASDWFQRTVATTPVPTSPEALRLLAERGRTRRVRHAADHRLRQGAPPRLP
ncbi:hypothetical protein [Streptomyces sp. NPDC055055]